MSRQWLNPVNQRLIQIMININLVMIEITNYRLMSTEKYLDHT